MTRLQRRNKVKWYKARKRAGYKYGNWLLGIKWVKVLRFKETNDAT